MNKSRRRWINQWCALHGHTTRHILNQSSNILYRFYVEVTEVPLRILKILKEVMTNVILEDTCQLQFLSVHGEPYYKQSLVGGCYQTTTTSSRSYTKKKQYQLVGGPLIPAHNASFLYIVMASQRCNNIIIVTRVLPLLCIDSKFFF